VLELFIQNRGKRRITHKYVLEVAFDVAISAAEADDETQLGSDRVQQDRGRPPLHLRRRLAALHRLGLRLRTALALHPVRPADLGHGNCFPRVTALPELTGTDTLVTVLLSLLGPGAMRTAEKFGGKAR